MMFPASETFFPEPLIRGLRVEISSFLGGFALAQTVAAVIERENIHAEREQRLIEAESMADVSAVAVAVQEDELRA